MRADVLRPWRPRSQEWSPAAAAHLLRRAGFGAAPGEVDALLARGVGAAVDEIMGRDEHDARLEGGVRALLPGGDVDRLAGWWMSLILAGGAPLRERVTLMWHGHFATSNAKLDDVRLMHRQNDTQRHKGLGDFRVLLHEMARDPAMLIWLDGGANKRGQPNENFAREVMELFALGIGNYDEHDIQEAARAFTGWGTRGRAFAFESRDHDAGEKSLFGVRGAFDGEDAIDLILARPACARHVARRLLIEFVAPDPGADWIDAAAQVLVANDWQVGSTIEHILRSELFFSARARRSRIAGPVELIASSARALGARLAPQAAALLAGEMGQALFRPPSVKGWDGMRAWINAGTWVARHNALHDLATGASGGKAFLDLPQVFSAAKHPAAAARVVIQVLMPDLVGSRLQGALELAVSGTKDLGRSLSMATALAMTSPEYQRT